MKRRVMFAVLVGCLTCFTPIISIASDTDTNTQIETLESEKAALQEEVDQLKSDNSKLEERIEQLESENAELKASQNEQTETETQVETEIVGVEYTDASVVKIVQETLNSNGYNCGTPDGVAGSKTTEAIKAYQKEKGINVNGVITDELLDALDVADKIDEAAKLEASKSEYSSDYTYEQLARNPDNYIGDKVKFTGKVLQAETGEMSYLRLAVNNDYDTVIFVTYDPEIITYRLLEDDYVTIYGSALSTYSYTAVSGATITLPWIVANIIELQ